MKNTAISQYQPFLFIKLATPFHFVRLSKMNTLNKSLCAALVAATSSFAAETQVVETTQAAVATENAAPASEAAASDAVATSEAQAN